MAGGAWQFKDGIVVAAVQVTKSDSGIGRQRGARTKCQRSFLDDHRRGAGDVGGGLRVISGMADGECTRAALGNGGASDGAANAEDAGVSATFADLNQRRCECNTGVEGERADVSRERGGIAEGEFGRAKRRVVSGDQFTFGNCHGAGEAWIRAGNRQDAIATFGQHTGAGDGTREDGGRARRRGHPQRAVGEGDGTWEIHGAFKGSTAGAIFGDS